MNLHSTAAVAGWMGCGLWAGRGGAACAGPAALAMLGFLGCLRWWDLKEEEKHDILQKKPPSYPAAEHVGHRKRVDLPQPEAPHGPSNRGDGGRAATVGGSDGAAMVARVSAREAGWTTSMDGAQGRQKSSCGAWSAPPGPR